MYVIIQKTKQIMTPRGVPNNISSGKSRKLYLLKKVKLEGDQHIFKNNLKGCHPQVSCPMYATILKFGDKSLMTYANFAQTYKLLCERISLKVMKI